jgi:WD40 repeat protein
MVRSFNIVKVLSHIDLDKIPPLKDEFVSKGNALDVENFIAVMKRQFHYIFELVSLFDLQQEERHMIAQLVDLFEIIDINGNNSMSWEEFTAFLVDQGMSEDVPRGFNIIKFGESQVVDEWHQSHCEKAFYFKHYDKIAYIEGGSRSLKLCSPDMVPYAELRDFTQTPLCATYIEKEGYVVVACSDLTISFYDANNSLRLVRRILAKTAQLVMCWSTAAHVLYSADHEGRIFTWDIAQVKLGTSRGHYEPGQGDEWKDFLKADGERKNMSMSNADKEEVQKGDDKVGEGQPTTTPRRQRAGAKAGEGQSTTPRRAAKDRSVSGEDGKHIVMALLELEVLGLLASCGIDKKVMLWDVFSGKLKTTLKGHKKGVRCMAFAPAMKVLVTGGYDYNLMVWNPYVERCVQTITGHTAHIVGIEVLGSSSNQVVSADSEGSVRTWDLGTYQCLQAISVGGILTLRAFISVPSHKRIFCVDRKFIAYDYLNTGVPDQTDEGPIIKAFYVPRLKVFISGCTTHLRIWDAVTGTIKCVIEHPESEITDFCVDDRGRKVFIADHMGEVYVYNSTTGCQIKKLTKHEEEVSGLIYCKGDKNLITVSWDHSIMVHDESEKIASVWRTATNIHAGDITCVAFSQHLGLIATGATDCVIALREYERLRTVKVLLGHKADVTALAFVDPLPLLVSADSNGNVAIWAVPIPSGRNHRFVNEVLTRFVNMQSLESSASVNCFDPLFTEELSTAVAATASDGTFLTGVGSTGAAPTAKGRLVLYSGDEDGDVRAWDLTRLLEVADIGPCAPKADWDPRKKDHIDSTHSTETMARKAMSAEQPELPIRLNEPVVKQVLSWRAHSDSVRSVRVYRQPDCVVTAGYDQMVKIWTLDGQMMTVLRAYGQIPWQFPVRADMIGIDEATLDGILERVRQVEKQVDKKVFKQRFTQPAVQLAAEVEGYKARGY